MFELQVSYTNSRVFPKTLHRHKLDTHDNVKSSMALTSASSSENNKTRLALASVFGPFGVHEIPVGRLNVS